MSRRFDINNEGDGWGYDFNPQANPAACGLETFAELSSEYAGSYEFDYLVLWIDKATNTLLAARDSGCSCPTPFEDYVETGQMVEVRSWDDVQGLIGSDGGGFDSAERFALRRKVEDFLAGMALAKEAVDAFCAQYDPSPYKVRPLDAIVAGTAREEDLLNRITDLEADLDTARGLNDMYLTVIRDQGQVLQSVRLLIGTYTDTERAGRF